MGALRPRTCRLCGKPAFLSSSLCFDCGRQELVGWRAYRDFLQESPWSTDRRQGYAIGFVLVLWAIQMAPLLRFRWVQDAAVLACVVGLLIWSGMSGLDTS